MGEKGSANRAKVVARTARELITVAECYGARLAPLSWLVYGAVTLPIIQRGAAQGGLDWDGFGISTQEPFHRIATAHTSTFHSANTPGAARPPLFHIQSTQLTFSNRALDARDESNAAYTVFPDSSAVPVQSPD